MTQSMTELTSRLSIAEEEKESCAAWVLELETQLAMAMERSYKAPNGRKKWEAKSLALQEWIVTLESKLAASQELLREKTK